MKHAFSRLMTLLLVLLLVGCKGPYTRLVPKSNVARQNHHDKTVFIYSMDALMESSSVKFREEAYADLYQVVNFARLYPNLNITVHVYEDNTMVSNMSENLARYRAEVIAAYFWSEGVAAKRISYKGYVLGYNPVSSNLTPDGSQDNRRVVVEFTDAKS